MQILADLQYPDLRLAHRLVADNHQQIPQAGDLGGPEPPFARDDGSVRLGDQRLNLLYLERFAQ